MQRIKENIKERLEKALQHQLKIKKRYGHAWLFAVASFSVFVPLLIYVSFLMFFGIPQNTEYSKLMMETSIRPAVSSIHGFYFFFIKPLTEDWFFILPIATILYYFKVRKMIFVPVMAVYFTALHFMNPFFSFSIALLLLPSALIHLHIYYDSGILYSSLYHFYSNSFILIFLLAFGGLA